MSRKKAAKSLSRYIKKNGMKKAGPSKDAGSKKLLTGGGEFLTGVDPDMREAILAAALEDLLRSVPVRPVFSPEEGGLPGAAELSLGGDRNLKVQGGTKVPWARGPGFYAALRGTF
jgi:hypothetical protein